MHISMFANVQIERGRVSPPSSPLFVNCERFAKHATTFSNTRRISKHFSDRSVKYSASTCKNAEGEGEKERGRA